MDDYDEMCENGLMEPRTDTGQCVDDGAKRN